MVDETTDLSNTEQLVLCIRYVDDCLNVHEEPVGLYSLESTTANSIMMTTQDILLRMNLQINNCLELNPEYVHVRSQIRSMYKNKGIGAMFYIHSLLYMAMHCIWLHKMD